MEWLVGNIKSDSRGCQCAVDSKSLLGSKEGDQCGGVRRG